MSKNGNLSKAKRAQNDEFYTRLEDVEAELVHYAKSDCFAGKHVYLNCDKPGKSAFWTYFYDNFQTLRLSLLSATYKTLDGRHATLYQYDGTDLTEKVLAEDGSYDSGECEAVLNSCDMVVTNPPFSLFLKYVSYLVEHDKDFIIIGNANSMFCRDMFPMLVSGSLHIGFTKPKIFEIPQTYTAGNVRAINGRKYATFGNICWYSTIDLGEEKPELPLTKQYSEALYEKYDNYDAIEVPSLKDIPYDYAGIMGVPVSIMEKWNPNQFEIVWQASGNTRSCCPPHLLEELGYTPLPDDRGGACVLNGKLKYTRVFIRNKRLQCSR